MTDDWSEEDPFDEIFMDKKQSKWYYKGIEHGKYLKQKELCVPPIKTYDQQTAEALIQELNNKIRNLEKELAYQNKRYGWCQTRELRLIKKLRKKEDSKMMHKKKNIEEGKIIFLKNFHCECEGSFVQTGSDCLKAFKEGIRIERARVVGIIKERHSFEHGGTSSKCDKYCPWKDFSKIAIEKLKEGK